ncbi:STAS domain-containing protein [Gelidibacter salicanalis]|uniref:Anti-sigma factor antagonist n=1 Tax=Gelidibacter salicanalis TaxID=291193 RepID=A0A934NIR8_9FLAO|nr:STAS domain-containing protein [Gelidibacter salicanalis]MBJ7881518.1 anti-sigma factor antagonist [Gelidibacter salicanalis]
MDLKITHQNNLFKVQGILHKGNVHVFKKEFSNIFDKQQALILNIEGLSSIDRYGVNALAQLHNESLKKKKELSIVGMGCDDLYEHFKSEEAAA